MSTAILISGQLRTFAQCWPTQRWHVLRHFADPHFFITVQGDLATEPAELSRLRFEYGNDHVHYDPRVDPDLFDQLTPELIAAYRHAPYTNAAPAHQLLLQHWYQRECWKFFQSISQEPAESAEKSSAPSASSCKKPSFETVIRLRADLYFHSLDISHSSLDIGDNVALTPWWGRFGGINDRFAIMGPTAAKAYFTVYDKIPELLAAGCPFHPETLVRAALETAGIEIHETLRTEFSTLRTNGQSRPPEIAPWDLAHAALRAA